MTKQPHTTDELAAREKAVLRLVRRVRIGLTDSVNRVVGDGADVTHVTRRLVARNLLENHERGIPGGISYTTITKRGLTEIGVTNVTPKRTLSSSILNLAVALTWYTTLEETRRTVLLADEVRKVLGESVPHNVPHVVEEISGEPAVLRVYHALGDLQTTKKHITDFIEKVQITPGLAALSDCRDYGLLVLSATLERNDELTKELTRQKLANTALVVCGVGPTVDTLAPLLRERRRRRAKPD